jgi:hypothetical protein
MESNIYPNETNNIDISNQTLSSIKSINFIKINNILGGTRLNCSRQYKALDNFKNGLNFQDRSSFIKHSRATDEVWYHVYHAKWTQREEIGGAMRRPTRSEDPDDDLTN